jgi:DNA-binding transcriptional LysR family regulator
MAPLSTTRLRILREVAERGTIAAAATALYLTPPAISHQLRVLELEVGVPLLERTARSIRLTDAGTRLVAHAETILAECETALADVATFVEQVTGTVRLSVFQTAAQTFALPAVASLRLSHPRLDVLISEMEPVRALPALKAGQLDVALSHEWDFVPVPQDPGVERHDLFVEPIVVLLPRDHRLATGPVRLKDLADERWCVAQESASSRQAVERVANSAGFEPQVVFESNYFRAIGSAIEAGLGVGVAPALTDLRGLDIAVLPLVEPTMTRRIFAAARRGSGGAPAIAAVIGAMAEAAAEREA